MTMLTSYIEDPHHFSYQYQPQHRSSMNILQCWHELTLALSSNKIACCFFIQIGKLDKETQIQNCRINPDQRLFQ